MELFEIINSCYRKYQRKAELSGLQIPANTPVSLSYSSLSARLCTITKILPVAHLREYLYKFLMLNLLNRAVFSSTMIESCSGSHKERFGADGKGKGLEGREDVIEDDGYVVGYTNKDTYDETHWLICQIDRNRKFRATPRTLTIKPIELFVR